MGIEFIEVETDLIILYPYVLSGVSCHFSTIEEYPQGAVTVAMPGHLMEILGGLALAMALPRPLKRAPTNSVAMVPVTTSLVL